MRAYSSPLSPSSAQGCAVSGLAAARVTVSTFSVMVGVYGARARTAPRVSVVNATHRWLQIAVWAEQTGPAKHGMGGYRAL